MSKRTTTIFSVFIAVAIFAGIFSYFYRGIANRYVAEYIQKISFCGNVTDEIVCLDKKYCEGIYGPLSNEDPTIVFKSCQRISQETLVALEQQQTLCEDTNGTWYKNRFGTSCLCGDPGTPLVFDEAQGCSIK